MDKRFSKINLSRRSLLMHLDISIVGNCEGLLISHIFYFKTIGS